MAIAPLTFTGISQFSDDFQTILQRSVSIASLPAKALENEQQDVLSKKMIVGGLRAAASDLAAAIGATGGLVSGGALAATSSSYAVQASAGAGAAPGLYQITNITSLAAQASARTASGVADTGSTQISSGDHQLELSVGGQTFTLALDATTDNLAGVRDAINAAGAGVTAAIIDSGAGPARYYLSLTANSPGETPIELRTSAGQPGSNILTPVSPGANAVFELNGVTITSNSNVVTNAVPGLTLELKATTAPGDVATVQIQPSAAPVVSALDAFTNAYNALVSRLDEQIGETAGLLSGDSVIGELGRALREITGYRGSGGLSSLFQLGISIDSGGHMSFDSTAVTILTPEALQDALAFFGDGSTGFSALESRLTALSDPTSGTLAALVESYDRTDKRLTDQITAIYDRVNAMQQTLMARLQAADTLLASLDGQKSMLTATIESLNTVSYGKRSSS